MFSHSEIVELRGNGSILLIGRRLCFAQLNRFDAKTCGRIEDPQGIADRVRTYASYPGNGLKLRHFWTAAAGGTMAPRNDLDMARDVGRIVAQGTWMALEIADERLTGSPVLERINRRKHPVLATLRGRSVATLSTNEKFALTFDKLSSHLGEGFAESLYALASPVALGVAAGTIAVLSFSSGGVVAAIILTVGYAVVGWAIFRAVGDLLDAIELVANATDERDLDRAAALLAKVASEITLGALIAVLTHGAARAAARGKGGSAQDEVPGSLSRSEQPAYPSRNEFRELVPPPKKLKELFDGSVPPKASALKSYAESKGWQPSQSEGGPLIYRDGNGIKRLTLKKGSPRAEGSSMPHVELRNADGLRIDPEGNLVSRKSLGNHTPIDYDF
ncbi:hypothetical protein [Thalassospira sp.]|uniref:hypothetical protein n=1 Tax=Thalassospira sp. TaxID=1912094 RepID=UPI003AA992E4